MVLTYRQYVEKGQQLGSTFSMVALKMFTKMTEKVVMKCRIDKYITAKLLTSITHLF